MVFNSGLFLTPLGKKNGFVEYDSGRYRDEIVLEISRTPITRTEALFDEIAISEPSTDLNNNILIYISNKRSGKPKEREFHLKERFDKLIDYEGQRVAGGSLDINLSRREEPNWLKKHRTSSKQNTLDSLKLEDITIEHDLTNPITPDISAYKARMKSSNKKVQVDLLSQRDRKRKLKKKKKKSYFTAKKLNSGKKGKKSRYYELIDNASTPNPTSKRDRIKAYDRKRRFEENIREADRAMDVIRSEKQVEQSKKMDDIRSKKAIQLHKKLETYRKSAIGRNRGRSNRSKSPDFNPDDYICSINIKRIEDDKESPNKKKFVGDMFIQEQDVDRSEIAENLGRLFDGIEIKQVEGAKGNTRGSRGASGGSGRVNLDENFADSLKKSLISSNANSRSNFFNRSHSGTSGRRRGNVPNSGLRGDRLSSKRKERGGRRFEFSQDSNERISIHREESNYNRDSVKDSFDTGGRNSLINLGNYGKEEQREDVNREGMEGLDGRGEGKREKAGVYRVPRQKKKKVNDVEGSYIESILGNMYQRSSSGPFEVDDEDKRLKKQKREIILNGLKKRSSDVEDHRGSSKRQTESKDQTSTALEVSLIERNSQKMRAKRHKPRIEDIQNNVRTVYNDYVSSKLKNSPRGKGDYVSPYSKRIKKKRVRMEEVDNNVEYESNVQIRELGEEENIRLEGNHDFRIDNLDSIELLEYYKELRMKGRKDWVKHQKQQSAIRKTGRVVDLHPSNY